MASGNREPPWKVYAHPDAQLPDGLPAAAVEAAGPDVFEHLSEPVLPKERTTGACRLCGVVAELTREHAPTKATTDLGPARKHAIEEWLARSSLDDALTGGLPTQGGIWGYTLCGPCNHFTGGEYGDEYKRWVFGAWALIRQLPGALKLGNDPDNVRDALDHLDRVDGWAQIDVVFQDVDAGRFVREVLAMMCSVTGPWALTDRHPEIRRIVLHGEPHPLPDPLRLTTSLYLGPAIRVIGPTLALTLDSGGWEWVCELAYPPFAHRLTVASAGAEPPFGLDSGELTIYPPGRRGSFTAKAQFGFGHTPFPGDFRSRAQIEAGRTT